MGLDDYVCHIGQDLYSPRGGSTGATWSYLRCLLTRNAAPLPHHPRPCTTLSPSPGPPTPHLQGDHNPKNLLLLVRQNVLDEGPARADQGDGDEEERALEPGEAGLMMRTDFSLPASRHLLQRGHSQVCDVVHDGEAFDGVALAVDEVVVDLEADGWMDSETGGWVAT